MAAEITLLDPPRLAVRARVLRLLRAHVADLRGLGAARLGLFGSLVRGDAGPEE